LELPNDSSSLEGNVYFAIRSKKVHLQAVFILPSEAKKNGKIVSAELCR